MKIPTSIVGTRVGPRLSEIDGRWLMAYAAALGEDAPEYFDTTRRDGILAHPLFPVCYEWPLALDIRAKAMPDDAMVRGVHATHALTLHRRPRAGDRLATTATVMTVERRAPGAYVLVRFETLDGAGRPVTSTDYGSLYRGVDCDGPPSHPGPPSRTRSPLGRGPQGEPQPEARRVDLKVRPRVSEVEGKAPDWSTDVPIAATLAHTYTECARIWNPIHTDRAVARAAGLPDIILHGTATLALAVAEALRRQDGGVTATVRGVACRFGAMVRLPSSLTVGGWSAERAPEGSAVRFEARTQDGRPAVRDGRLVLSP